MTVRLDMYNVAETTRTWITSRTMTDEEYYYLTGAPSSPRRESSRVARRGCSPRPPPQHIRCQCYSTDDEEMLVFCLLVSCTGNDEDRLLHDTSRQNISARKVFLKTTRSITDKVSDSVLLSLSSTSCEFETLEGQTR
jgi:hypothetical protein